jgi:hypothetical protein
MVMLVAFKYRDIQMLWCNGMKIGNAAAAWQSLVDEFRKRLLILTSSTLPARAQEPSAVLLFAYLHPICH